MLAESKAVVQGVTDVNGEHSSEHIRAGQIVVYEGFLTQLITQQLNLSVPYYTSVRQALINMGCIKQLRRGGGSSPSQWEMITEPTVEAFMQQRPPKAPKQDKYSMLQDQLTTLGSRIVELEDMVQDLVSAWAREFGSKKVDE
jgi:hypothetical protein